MIEGLTVALGRDPHRLPNIPDLKSPTLALQFYVLRPGDTEQLTNLNRGLAGTMKSNSHRVGFNFDHADPSIEAPEGNRVVFVLGLDQNRILGVASCKEGGPGSKIGDVSHLTAFSDAEAAPITDLEGKEVTRENLGDADGFSAFTGGGKLLHIGMIQTFAQRCGLGAKFLDCIKAAGYEIIEAEANGLEQAEFFESQGFVDTNLTCSKGEQLILVWNQQTEDRK